MYWNNLRIELGTTGLKIMEIILRLLNNVVLQHFPSTLSSNYFSKLFHGILMCSKDSECFPRFLKKMSALFMLPNSNLHDLFICF